VANSSAAIQLRNEGSTLRGDITVDIETAKLSTDVQMRRDRSIKPNAAVLPERLKLIEAGADNRLSGAARVQPGMESETVVVPVSGGDSSQLPKQIRVAKLAI
jgi:hypothetical protein